MVQVESREPVSTPAVRPEWFASERPDGMEINSEEARRFANSLPKGAFQPSEYALANIWLFRRRHHYRMRRSTAGPFLSGVTYDGVAHAFPDSKWNAGRAASVLSAGVDCLFPCNADFARDAEREGFVTSFDEADSDYWYDAAAMATLVNARTRRQQADSFEKSHAPVGVCWSSELAGEALEILQGWEADTGNGPEDADGLECREAIDEARELGLTGMLVRTGAGVPVAFCLSSCFGNDNIVHFAKARREWSHAYPCYFPASPDGRMGAGSASSRISANRGLPSRSAPILLRGSSRNFVFVLPPNDP